MFEITASPVSLDRVVKAVRRPSCGAVVSFLGTVREFSQDRTVDHLEFEAYPEMAEGKLRQIGEEIAARWPGTATAISHRVGRMEVGDAIVAIAVSAPHRREAFEACSYAIDRLKRIVPVWKKEVWSDGAAWVEGPAE